jgi:hypothetical protein
VRSGAGRLCEVHAVSRGNINIWDRAVMVNASHAEEVEGDSTSRRWNLESMLSGSRARVRPGSGFFDSATPGGCKRAANERKQEVRPMGIGSECSLSSHVAVLAESPAWSPSLMRFPDASSTSHAPRHRLDRSQNQYRRLRRLPRFAAM